MSSAETDAIPTRIDKSGIAWINAGSLFAQIVQVGGYPTMLALLLDKINYSGWLIGTVLSFQWVVVLFAAHATPYILKRTGVKFASQLGSAISILSLIFAAVSHALPALVLSSLLMGFGLTIRWVACDTWIVHASPEGTRGRAIGIHETLMGLGIAVGPVLLIFASGNEQTSLYGYAALLILSVIAFSFGSSVEKPEEDVSHTKHLTRLVRLLALALIATIAAGYIETSMVSLLPLYLISFDYPQYNALIALSVFGLGGTLLQVPIGWIADKYGFRAAQALCISVIIAGALLLITAIGVPGIILVSLFFWGGCIGGLNTLAVIEAGSTLPSSLSGIGMAMVASAYTFGSVIGPMISGATLETAGGHGAIIIITLLMTGYAATLVWIKLRPATAPENES
ncbi:MFS transporter [Phyllobacterium sp. YR531]|uniref:MFS transporter n=1 Tax=Phyllobacterium sp. YR531 TaxID=1144343 RepID=UPI00026FC3BA|nr:MFS transporter [Phyllobacterium sp. YR531]EJN02356.1 arabinose efflux permease family protein [Phyllobacterium sp. YR531]